MQMIGAHRHLLRQLIQREGLLLFQQATGFFDHQSTSGQGVLLIGAATFARAKPGL
jgi:hypothetical protein